MQAATTATNAAPTMSQRAPNSVLETLADGTSPSCVKYQGNLRGELYDNYLKQTEWPRPKHCHTSSWRQSHA